MADYGNLQVHPVADLFPLIEGEEFDLLVADIAEAGLQEPIVLAPDGQTLVDGRNRYRACVKAGREHAFRTLGEQYTEGRIIQLIISANLRRRHLDVGQRAMVAVEVEKAYAAETRPGRPSKTVPNLAPFRGKSRERAAKDVGVSNGAVQQAKKITEVAPDLAAEVKNGTRKLSDAYQKARQRERNRPKPEPQASRPAPVMLTLRTHTGEAVPYPEPQSNATFNETRGEGISWASWSWNPVTGCLHGCRYCYAREIATSELYKGGFPAGFTPLFHDERLDAPANTAIPVAHRDEKKPCHPFGCPYPRVFVCSMADLYGRWVPDEWIRKVHDSMLAWPAWQYILLTKFPARYVGLDLPPGAWVGTSVDEQKRVRIAEDAFRKIDGVTVKWLSLEPLLEPLQFDDLSMFDWVVIGAQTETRQPDGVVPAFTPPFEWVARLYVQAKNAGCKVHIKPNVLQKPPMQLPDEYPTGRDA